MKDKIIESIEKFSKDHGHFDEIIENSMPLIEIEEIETIPMLLLFLNNFISKLEINNKMLAIFYKQFKNVKDRI